MTGFESLYDRLRSVDPAAGLDTDPDGPAGQQVLRRVLQDGDVVQRPASADRPTRRRIPRRRLAVVVALATLLVSGAVIAVADIFTAATPLDDGADYMAACFEADAGCRDAVMDDIRENGSDVEQAIAADGVVTAEEYTRAADTVVACAEGLDVEAVRTEADGGWYYGFLIRQADRDDTLDGCMLDHFERINQLWQAQGSVAPDQ